jgi:hypothetical protein
MTFSLRSKDGIFYIDPFTGKTAIFADKKIASMTMMMLFSQQNLELEVIEN